MDHAMSGASASPKSFNIKVLDDGTFLLTMDREKTSVQYSYDNLDDIFEDIKNDLDLSDGEKDVSESTGKAGNLAKKITSMEDSQDA